MKNLKDNMGNLLMSLCELVIGILLLINPTGFTSSVIIVIGVVLLLRGILNVISYFRTNSEEAAREHSLAGGIVLLAVGLRGYYRISQRCAAAQGLHGGIPGALS